MSVYSKELIGKNELSEQDFMRMYQLVDSYYENITPKEFFRALAKIDYIFLVRGGQNSVLAFTTLQLLHIGGKRQNIQGLLVGDIILHKDYAESINIFAEAITRYHLQGVKGKVGYVYLACKDIWTYQMFQEAFGRCYPNQREKTPLSVRKLINLFGEFYFHHEFEKSTGWIKHTCMPQQKIRENRMRAYKGECVFFSFQNQEYRKGHELVCIAELSENKSNASKNLT